MGKGLWGRLELERYLEEGQEHSAVPRKGLVCDSGVDMHDRGILPIVVYGSGPMGPSVVCKEKQDPGPGLKDQRGTSPSD